MDTFKKGDKKILNAWAFYDWANSVYALVITSSIFPLFYGALFRIEGVTSIPFFGIDTPSESIISYVTAIGFVIISICSPILSGVADYLRSEERRVGKECRFRCSRYDYKRNMKRWK